MTYTPAQAYSAIKSLEALGNLQIHPLGVQTVVIGTFDAATGRFTWALPTTTLTVVEDPTPLPHAPIGKPITLHVTAGEIAYSADTLMLQVNIANSKAPVTLQFGSVTATAAAGQTSVAVSSAGWVATPGDTTSSAWEYAVVTSGTAKLSMPLQIFSMPRLGAGVLTLPAVPVGLIYAPPPGGQNKNYAAYTDLVSIGQKIQSSVTSGTTTKTATAYTTGDFISKISGLASTIGTLAGVGPAVKAFLGPITTALSDLAGILGSTTASTTNTVSTTTDHAIQTTISWSSSYQTPPGTGPGIGDRFIYIRNVRLAWLITDGQLSFYVLGDDGIRDFTARQLSSDAAAMAASTSMQAGPVTGLDAATIASLLAVDPFVSGPTPTLHAPRFEVNDPASVGGGDTGTGGDAISVSHEITATDTATKNTVVTHVTDAKPGWLDALFGNNQTSETQLSMTMQSTVQTTTQNKQTLTVYFFSAATDQPYLTGLYYDTLFNSLAFMPWKAGQLATTPVVPAA
jgi:hypothetical protein